MKVKNTNSTLSRRAHNSSLSEGISFNGLQYAGPTAIFRDAYPEPAVVLETFSGRISRLAAAGKINDQRIHEALYLSAKAYQSKYGRRRTYVQFLDRTVELNDAYGTSPFKAAVPYATFRQRVVSYQVRGTLDENLLRDAIAMTELEWMSFHGGGRYRSFVYDGIDFPNQIGKKFHSISAFLKTIGRYSEKVLVWSRLKAGWDLDSAISIPMELPTKRAGLIYKISRTKTGQIYVGLSVTSFRQRWKFHLHAVRKGSQTKLAKAIREDGPDGFIGEVIEEEILDPATLREREIHWVEQLNALGPGGLNTARPGGLGGAKGFRTVVNGEVFRSRQEASQVIAERLGIPDFAVLSRIQAGSPIPLRIRKHSTHPEAGSPLFRRWLGLLKRHPNQVAADWVNSYDKFKQDISPIYLEQELVRIDDAQPWGAKNIRWVTTQKKVELVHGKAVSIHGVVYPSLKAVAARFGIGVSTLKDRIGRQGMSVEDAIDIPLGASSYQRVELPIEIDGQIFRSKRQAVIFLVGKGMTEYFARLQVDSIVSAIHRRSNLVSK